MGLLTYRQRRRHKYKLKIDMEVEALQESINFQMSNRKFREAMLSIKKIWLLKSRPWIYSSTMVTYIECLIREGQIIDIAPVEKQLLTFYRTVLDISPRQLMNFAHEAKRYSHRRSVYASLLSYYACVLAENTWKIPKTIYLSVESAHLIKDVIEILTVDDANVAEYLLKMMEELHRRIDVVHTTDKKKITIKDKSKRSVKNAITRASTSTKETRRVQRHKSTNGKMTLRSRKFKIYKPVSTSSKPPSTSKDQDLESIHINDTPGNTPSHGYEIISRTSPQSLQADIHTSEESVRRPISGRESQLCNERRSGATPLADSSLSGILTVSDDKPIPYEDVVSNGPTIEILYDDDGPRDTPYISLC